MAETYYKYQERDQQAQINWAEVGKNFSETLQSEAESREKKKAAIDEATRKYQNNLDSQPHGTSTTIRQWGLNFGASAQEVMLMQEKLLKSGQLDPSDYTIMRQNLVDGTDDAFDLMQYYQDEYATKMERMNEADPAKASQYLETWLMENVEGFGDFNRSEAFINPRNGQVMAAFKKKNEKSGVMELDTSPDNMRSVSSLKGNILGKFNKYQLENETSSFVASQGNWEEVTRTLGSSQKAGLLEILSDPMAKTMTKEQLIALKLDPSQAETVNYYFESEQAWITAQMSNDYNVSSMLTDYVTRTSDGSKYAYTYDAEKAKNDSSLILLNDDGQGRPVPEFNDEQEEDVRKKIATSIRSKINKTVKTQGMSDFNRPSDSQITRGDGQRKVDDMMGFWADLYSAETATSANATIQGILGSDLAKSQGMLSIEFSENGDELQVTYTDSQKNRPIPIGANPTQEDWIKIGIELYGDYDIGDATNAAGKFKDGSTYDPSLVKGISARRQGEAPVSNQSPIDAAVNRVVGGIPAETFKKVDEDIFEEVESKLLLMGLEVENDWDGEYLLIKNPVTKAETKIRTNVNDKESKVQKEKLDNFVRGQMTDEIADKIAKSSSSPSADDI
jgi:hypothetical protein